MSDLMTSSFSDTLLPKDFLLFPGSTTSWRPVFKHTLGRQSKFYTVTLCLVLGTGAMEEPMTSSK